MNKPTLVSVVLAASRRGDRYDHDRTLYSVFNHVVEEIGETSTEISIVMGDSNKSPGPDGVVGEAIDAIVSLLDLIYKFDSSITEEDMAVIAQMKCDKWINGLKTNSGI